MSQIKYAANASAVEFLAGYPGASMGTLQPVISLSGMTTTGAPVAIDATTTLSISLSGGGSMNFGIQILRNGAGTNGYLTISSDDLARQPTPFILPISLNAIESSSVIGGTPTYTLAISYGLNQETWANIKLTNTTIKFREIKK